MNDKFLLVFDGDCLSTVRMLDIKNLSTKYPVKITSQIEMPELVLANLKKLKFIIIISSSSKFLNYFSNKSCILPICIDDEKDSLNNSYDILFLPSSDFFSRLPNILNLKNLIALLNLHIEDLQNFTNILKRNFEDKYLFKMDSYVW
jgi:hypothetical protein